MDFGFNGGNGSGDNHEQNSDSNQAQKYHHRHTPQQIQQLESFFKNCPHPNEIQRQRLSRDLGLEPNQIKFWFQNKRTQNKAQNERDDNNTLRLENERIQSENLAIEGAIKNVICPCCRDPPIGEEELRRNVEQLKIENALLKQEHERVSLMLANMSGKQVTDIQSLSPPGFPFQFKGIQETEKSLVVETAATAFNELLELLQLNEPLWIKSQNDSSSILNRDIYSELFPKVNRLTSSQSRIESSKDSCVVTIPAQKLLEMFLDSSKWTNLFPTIVPRAKTLQLIDAQNLSGFLLLMYEQMHVLSPLVAPREFFFLRYSQPLEPAGTWVVVDVSYNCIQETENASPTRSWKLPSGCMIQSLPNGKTKVTWVEHVEVEDVPETHHLYKDLECCGHAYGARRWTTTLERMCERLIYATGSEVGTTHHVGRVINLREGHKNVLKICQKMVKDFCEMLSISDKPNDRGVRVSVRRSSDVSRPNATIVSAATSLWLPLSRDTLFNFFKDPITRPQWDAVTPGHLANEIAHISCGAHPGNCVSIIQPVPHEKDKLILQENYIDPLGAFVVYAPIRLEAITALLNGEDTGKLVVIPSGFIILGDGRSMVNLRRTDGASTSMSSGSSRQSGSILTMAFQVQVDVESRQMSMLQALASTFDNLISSTVRKIKSAFNIENLE